MSRFLHLPTFAVFLGYKILSFIRPTDYALVLQRYYAIFSVLIIFLVLVKWVSDKTEIRGEAVLNAICISGIFEIAYIIAQWAGLADVTYRYHGIAGSHVNPSILGLELSFYFPIGIYLFAKSSGARKTIWAIMSIYFFIFIILSESRTAIISSVFSSAIILSQEFHVKIFKNKKLSALILATIAAISIILFFYKIDSVKGRMLIWTVCLRMIAEKPWSGWGVNGFAKKYMSHQADFFEQHPDSCFSVFADNISHPFNEYLKCCIRFGIPVMIIVVFANICLIYYLWMYRHKVSSVVICCVVNVTLWSMVSYPLQIPFVWITIVYVVGYFLYKFIRLNDCRYIMLGLVCCYVYPLYATSQNFIHDIGRLNLHKYIYREDKELVKDRYYRAFGEYKHDESFLYDYGSILHRFGEYDSSLKVLNRCSSYLSDYNLQLLIADDYKQLGMTDSALVAFRYAGRMIPSRFLPLYYEMMTYEESGNHTCAVRLANEIMAKPVKISKSISARKIKQEAQNIIQQNQHKE